MSANPNLRSEAPGSAPAITPDGAPAVEFRRICKHFGGLAANSDVNLRIRSGTIHGIIGENGAGKSTAMNMLYGMFRPDSGDILIEGCPCRWSSPADAIARGIGMVHQHFMLAGPISALDNFLLSARPGAWGLLHRAAARARLNLLAGQHGFQLDWDLPIEQLPVGLQQRIEILKLLDRDARILIFDEPTAVLTPREASALFHNLQKLRAQGKTILLITHKLTEVMAFTDCVTVFRHGRVAGVRETAETNAQELAEMMVGKKVTLSVQAPPAQPRPEAALEALGLTLAGSRGARPRLSEINICVRRGEIVGIAGVEGNGQMELLQALLHPNERNCRTAGVVRILGHEVTAWPSARIRALGVGVIHPDRLAEGLLPGRPARENFLLGLQRNPAFSRAGLLLPKNISARAAQAVEDYDVRPRNLDLGVGKLSGGNQQKLIVAREFERRPQLLIAAQPTRGVDVGAIEFIHRRLVEARDQGAGVLLVSSELDEILALSDRILVMYEGRITAEFQRGKASEQEIGLKMGGA